MSAKDGTPSRVPSSTCDVVVIAGNNYFRTTIGRERKVPKDIRGKDTNVASPCEDTLEAGEEPIMMCRHDECGPTLRIDMLGCSGSLLEIAAGT